MKRAKPDQKEVLAKVVPLIQKAFKVVTSDPLECIRLAESVLKISQKHSFNRGIGQAHLHIGLGRYHQGELDAALEKYRVAEETFLKDDDHIGLRSVYNNMGVVYCKWKDWDRALEYFQKNLDLDERAPNPSLSTVILVNLGNIHSWSQDFAAARECYQRALSLAHQHNNDYGEGLANAQMGSLLVKQNKLNEAMEYLNRSLEIRGRNQDLSGLILVHHQIANLLLAQKDTAKALEQLGTALELAERLDDKFAIAVLAKSFGDAYRQLGDRAREKEYLELCLSHSSQHQYRDYEAQALCELAHWHEQAGDFEAALKTYWRYQEAKNFLVDQERNHTIQQLRVQLQVAEKEREMKLIRQTNLELAKKNRLINRQKNQLEKAEKALLEWNHTLEQRVQEEIAKSRQQEHFLIQKSKLESLGRMAAGIAHEINQPLGMINIGIQNLINKIRKGNPSTNYIEEKLAYFNENMERIQRIIEHVRLFSRDQQDAVFERVDLRTTIDRALDMIRIQCRDQNITLATDTGDAPLLVLGNQYRLEQVILNLLSNAIDALNERYDPFDDARRISIRAFQQGERVMIEVADNGNGIAKQDLEHIFDPFFTTKAESQGTGLGLSICYGIINDLGGRISCTSQPGEGATFSVELPALNKGDL